MDDLLKLAADAGHDVSTAEDAIEEGAPADLVVLTGADVRPLAR